MALEDKIKSLLSLTGQQHKEEFPYDEVYTVTNVYQRGLFEFGTHVIGALGRKGNRIVDIAVDPEFRNKGIATTLIKLSGCDTAFAVEDSARAFWRHIGWQQGEDQIDKGTQVSVFRK